jgi:aryl-alcohol dehydrogenase-like predicted oxidoreductase
MEMRTRILGKTGLTVSELCLGSATFGGLGVYKYSGALSQSEADRIVGMALDAGINFFNTAEIYSDGLAEEILGKALGKRRNDVILITKLHPTKEPGKNDKGFSRKHIIEGTEASLKRLGTDYVDILELHQFDPDTPLETTLRALDDLVSQGKVRYIGCSNFTAWQLMKGLQISEKNHWEKFVTLEAMYSLLSRELEYELIPACIDQGVSLLSFSPLYGGFLSGKYGRNKEWPSGTRFKSLENTQPWPVETEKLYEVVDTLEAVAAAHSATVSQAALNYVLAKPGICSAIMGIRTEEQLMDNLRAVEWKLTREEIKLLDKVSEPQRRYPYFVLDPVSESEAK